MEAPVRVVKHRKGTACLDLFMSFEKSNRLIAYCDFDLDVMWRKEVLTLGT